MIEFRNHHRADIQRISEEDELPMMLFIPVDDVSNLLRILPSGLFAVHVSDGIEQDTGTWRKAPRPLHRFEVVVLLAPDDEVSSDGIDSEQSREVVVASVEDVERVLVHTGWRPSHSCH